MSQTSLPLALAFFWIALACTCCVGQQPAATDVDFDTEIVPLLSKAGCNAASCHGGAAGQAGFRLSLFGGDPDFDYRTIVHELGGRRIRHEHPYESLILAKPTGHLDHGGGDVLDPDGVASQTIARWIQSGTPRLRLRNLSRLEIKPTAISLDTVPAVSQLRVTAVFDDGHTSDVTQDAVYVSQNDTAVQMDENGRVTIAGTGRNSIIVRYGSRVRTVSVTAPVGKTPTIPAEMSRNSWVDDEINKTLAALNLAPASLTEDRSFLRRLSLDLTGRLPTPLQVQQFSQAHEPNKRAALIDVLLDSDEFTEYWTHRLAKHLRLRKPGVDEVAAEAFYGWLKQQVAQDAGWDDISHALILSVGDTHKQGAATVHRFFATGRDQAEYVTETLMGVRLRCANCHNHPLDQWTQDDYHGLATIFAGLERGTVVRYSGSGNVIHPRTGTPARPKIPGEQFLTGQADHRKAFADWLTRHDNPYFARAMAGRVWESLMGQGLVSPVDDLRATNPATHPELLRRLSAYFADHDYRLRPLIRLLCNSAAYQRGVSTRSNDRTTGRFYAATLPQPLSAEVLADAIDDVTGIATDYDGVQRAIQIIEPATTTAPLQFLGKCATNEGCSASGGTTRGIASKLHLMNGALLNEKLEHPNGRLSVLLGKRTSLGEIVREFYLRALSRPPTEDERSAWISRIQAADDDEMAKRCNDFVWAILNCHEFTTNH